MKNFGLYFSYVIGFLMRMMPRFVIKALGWGLAILWWDILRFRRFTVYRNLTIAFPQMPHDQKRRIAKRSIAWLGINFFDFLQIPMLKESDIGKRVVFDGMHHFDEARKEGRGVLLLSLHLGNGDMATASMALARLPVHLISKKFKIKWLNDWWFGVREKRGVRFIDPHGSKTAFDILKATSKNEAVIFVLDQFMGKPYGIETRFFGKKTGTAYGLALFALKTKAPVLPVWIYMDEHDITHICFGPPIPNIENENRDLQTKEMTEKYNQVLEDLIRAHPEQWMWVHRRWKKWE